MASNRLQSEETRRKAHEKFAKSEQRAKTVLSERHKAIAAVAAKSARLRALRLAKEAADNEAAAKKAAEKAAEKSKTNRSRAASARA
jgi:hypothetical protein